MTGPWANRRKLAALLTAAALLVPAEISGQNERPLPPKEVQPQPAAQLPYKLPIPMRSTPTLEPNTEPAEGDLGKPIKVPGSEILNKRPVLNLPTETQPAPPESNRANNNLGKPIKLPGSETFNRPPALNLPTNAPPTESLPPTEPIKPPPKEAPGPSETAIEQSPTPAMVPDSPSSSPPPDEQMSSPGEGSQADAKEEEPQAAEPSAPSIVTEAPQDDSRARERRKRRDRDRYNTYRAQQMQQSVRDAAARADDDGESVVSVRGGGSRPATRDLTSQIDSVSQGMTVTNAPPVVTPPAGGSGIIFYSPSGSPIPVNDDGKTPPTLTSTPQSTPITPVSSPPTSTSTPPGISTPRSTPASPTSTPTDQPVPTGPTINQTPITTTSTTTERPPLGPTRERHPPLGPTRARDPERPIPPEVPEDIHLTPPPGIPPSVPPPEVPGEKPCCGMTANVVFFPKTVDWLKPAEEQEARHDRAEAAKGVLLHDGSFALDQTDLLVRSVGFPMEISHHYRSELEDTVKGGIIGHKWDLGINKRIVPEGAGETADHLVFERIGIDKPKLVYYDGHGRADRYEGVGSETRTVRNFGIEFEALVTTYKSPPGAFHEIQRYVLLPGQKHPFQNHVNVDEMQRIFYVLREKNGLQYIFNCRGQLIYIIDRHKNTMDLRYLGDLNPLTHNPMLSLVFDTAGRKYIFETLNLPADDATIGTNIKCKPVNGKLPIPRFSTITEVATGRQITFRYKDGMYPILNSVTQNFDRSLYHEYAYAGGEDYLLTTVTAPEQALNGGGPYLTNTWDFDKKRVNSQQWGTGSYKLTYTGDPRVTAADVVDPTGGRSHYKLARVGGGPVIEETTLRGSNSSSSETWTHRFAHNAASQVTQITYPRGNSIQFVYEAGNRPVKLGPIRDWVERDVTYMNNLQMGNLIGITWTSNERDDPYKEITITKTYEDLYNQLEVEVDKRGSRTVNLYAYDRGTGYNGKAYETQLPDLTRPTTTKLTGLKQSFAYTKRGQLSSETDTAGRVSSYTYDTFGYMTQMVTPAGTTSFTVDSRGNVVSKSMPGGRVDTFEYNLRDLQTESVADSTGFANKSTLGYDLNGMLTRRTIDVKDNFDDRVSSGLKPSGASPGEFVETMVYDILNRPTSEVAQGPGVSTTVTRQYDGLGRVVAMTGPSNAGSGTIVTNTVYDARGRVIEQTEAAGTTSARRKTFRHDANGNLEISRGAGDLEEHFSYDGFDRIKSQLSVNGALSTFERDKAGNITKTTVNGSSGRSTGRRMENIELARTESVFDEMNNLVTRKRHVLTSPGTVDEYWIYNRGLDIETEKGPGSGSTTYTYDGAGRVISATDPSGTTTQHNYDAAGFRSGLVEEWKARSFRARAGWSEAKASRSWTFTNDRLGRMIQQAGPDGTTKHFYNSLGKIRGTLNENGELTSQTFDAKGNRLTVSTGGKTETYTYSAGGKMTGAKSPVRDEAWQYNALGDLLSHTDNNAGRTTRHQLNGDGFVLRTTDPNGTVINRDLDPAGNPTKVTIVPAHFGATYSGVFYSGYRGPNFLEYRYDALGRIAFATNSETVTVERKYDGLGNIVEDIQTFAGNAQTVGKTLSADQRTATLTYPQIAGGVTLTTNMDDAGRVSTVSLGSGSTIARFDYAGRGYVYRRHYANFVDTAYNYDARMRTTNISVMNGAGPNTYKTYWSGRASYDGSTPTNIVQVVSDQNGPDRLITSRTTLDSRKRPLGTVTTQATPAYNGNPATSMTSGMLRQYNASGQPTTVVEYLRDDLAPEGRTAGKMLYVQSDDLDHNKAGRVASATAHVNKEARENANLSLSDVKDIAEQGAHEHKQEFYFDRNGNLLSDDRFIYSYDQENRLTMIRDRWQPYGYEHWSQIYYDPLGRRVAIRNRQPPATTGFVQWGSTYIPDVRFIYDGSFPIVETLVRHPKAPRETLLTRYYYGNEAQDLIRMDRRHDDDPTGVFDIFYVHRGFEGSIALLSDESGEPKLFASRDPPGRDRPGAAGSPPGDQIVINHTLTRMPYTSTRLRIDGYAGMSYDVIAGRYVFDFQRNYILDRNLSTQEFRESITRYQNKGAVVLAGITTLPFTATSGWAPFFGAVGLGIDWGTAYRTQSGYSLEQGATTFMIAASGARIGLAVGELGGGLAAQFAANYATNTAYSTFVKHGWNDQPFGEALSSSMKEAAVFGTVGFGASLVVPKVFGQLGKVHKGVRTRIAAKFNKTNAGGAARLQARSLANQAELEARGMGPGQTVEALSDAQRSALFAGDDTLQFTYRGDSRAPSVVFEEGFEPIGQSTDIYAHARNNKSPPSHYISTSKSYEAAEAFIRFLRQEQRSVFVIRSRNGVDVNKALGIDSPSAYEVEVAIPGKVDTANIRAVTLEHRGISILNPNWRP